MLNCKTCIFCGFNGGKGRPGKYFCLHPQNPSSVARTAAFKFICKTERRSTEFTIKNTPKWCPEVQNSAGGAKW